MDNQNNLFSGWFEKRLITGLTKLFDKFLEIYLANNEKGFIKRENAQTYYDGISESTLIKYENMGLKRYQPVENGTVFYSKKDLDEFMIKFEI